MTQLLLPAIWLLILIVGLPQFSETVYTPALPDIAKSLHVSHAIVEYTLTIYLYGFSIGTLIWGNLSDKFGRKPCVGFGLIIYILGCIGCYFSQTITTLMLFRFIQAFGGSVGSVLGQAIARDAFHGPALGKAYAAVGMGLALFPVIGPIVGGLTAQYFGWYNVFLLLSAFGLIVLGCVVQFLPETHHEQRKAINIVQIAKTLAHDKKVLCYGLLVAGCNGIGFSYFAEASFILIDRLGLTPTQYGLSFILLAMSGLLSGLCSHKLHNKYTSTVILRWGVWIMIAAASFSVVISLLNLMLGLSTYLLMATIILGQTGLVFGIGFVTGNSLALALVDYKWCAGTAASIFGAYYYSLIGFTTLGMGMLHTGGLLPMPLYFLVISLGLAVVEWRIRFGSRQAV